VKKRDRSVALQQGRRTVGGRHGGRAVRRDAQRRTVLLFDVAVTMVMVDGRRVAVWRVVVGRGRRLHVMIMFVRIDV